MARWPNVPAVYGWLSVNDQGQWRLHPGGNGHTLEANGSYPSGEPIGSEQIQQFINRNYAYDSSGRWFFQNGPQRVFVRIDAAPYIISVWPQGQGVALHTHTGATVSGIDSCIIDDSGRMFLKTDLGPAMIAGRDAPVVFEYLRTAHDQEVTELPTPGQPDQIISLPLQALSHTRKLRFAFRAIHSEALHAILGFVRIPEPDATQERRTR